MCVFLCVTDPRFVGVYLIPESDNPEDDKIYLFFRENAMDGEHVGKATHARIGQLCKVCIHTFTGIHKSWLDAKAEMTIHTHTHSRTDIM